MGLQKNKRLHALACRLKGGTLEFKTDATLRRDSKISDIKVLDYLVRHYVPRVADLRERLARTGRNIPLGQYLLINILILAAVYTYCIGVAEMSLVVSLVFAVLAGGGMPHLVISKMIARRGKKFIQFFPEAIDLMVRGLKSGLPITESLKTIASEMPSPVSDEFQLITDQLKLGEELSDALWQTAHRLGLPEFKFFVIALSIQRETGGNLAETLQNLSEVLRGRKQVQLKIKAMSSEANASAYIIGSLPFIMFLLIWKMNPEYIELLFTDPRGKAMLIFGLLMIAVGAGVMRKMVRFET